MSWGWVNDKFSLRKSETDIATRIIGAQGVRNTLLSSSSLTTKEGSSSKDYEFKQAYGYLKFFKKKS
jgi:hypothetical protein